MLDILAGWRNTGDVLGSITIDGQPRKVADFKLVASVVRCSIVSKFETVDIRLRAARRADAADVDSERTVAIHSVVVL